MTYCLFILVTLDSSASSVESSSSQVNGSNLLAVMSEGGVRHISMAQSILDAIDKISKGKGTRLRIGSRAVPHRLTQKERTQLERALMRGYLEMYVWNRVNVKNIFEKIVKAKNSPVIILTHATDSSSLSLDSLSIDLNIEAVSSHLQEWIKEDTRYKKIFKSRKESKQYAQRFVLMIKDACR